MCYATKLSNLSGRYCKVKNHPQPGQKGRQTDRRNPSKIYSKSKYVLLGSKEFKEKTRREAKENPIMMESHEMEESPEEKYLGDQIHKDETAASVNETINNRIPITFNLWSDLEKQPKVI